MKKIVILIIGVICSILASAQFNVTNSQGYIKLTDPQYNLDALILLNGIDDNTNISYTGTESIEWHYTISGEKYNSNQTSIIPESDILYTIYVNGSAKYYIYTIDYTQYLSNLHSLEVLESENCLST